MLEVAEDSCTMLRHVFAVWSIFTVCADPFTPGSLLVLRVGDPSVPTLSKVASLVSLVEIATSSGASPLQVLPLTPTSLASAANATLSIDDSTEGAMSVDANGCEVALLGYNVALGSPLTSPSKPLTAVTLAYNGVPSVVGVWPFVGSGYSRADGAVPAPGGAGVYAVAGQAAGCAVAFFNTSSGSGRGEYTDIFPGGGPTFAARGVSIAGSAADEVPNYQLFVGSGNIARAIGTGLPSSMATSRNTLFDKDMGAGFLFVNDSVAYLTARDNVTANTPRSVHQHVCSPQGACPRGGAWVRTQGYDLACVVEGEPQDLYFLDADISRGLDTPLFFASTARGDKVLRLDSVTGECMVLATAPINTVYRGLALSPVQGPHCAPPPSASPSPSISSPPTVSPTGTRTASRPGTRSATPTPTQGANGGGNSPTSTTPPPQTNATGLAVGLTLGCLGVFAGIAGWYYRGHLKSCISHQGWMVERGGSSTTSSAQLNPQRPDAGVSATRVKMLGMSDSTPLILRA